MSIPVVITCVTKVGLAYMMVSWYLPGRIKEYNEMYFIVTNVAQSFLHRGNFAIKSPCTTVSKFIISY